MSEPLSVDCAVHHAIGSTRKNREKGRQFFPKTNALVFPDQMSTVRQRTSLHLGLNVPTASECAGSMLAALGASPEVQTLYFGPTHVVCPVAGILDERRVVCLVVDECHRSTGNYATVKAVKMMKKQNIKFRVVGLTATPGRSRQVVQVRDGAQNHRCWRLLLSAKVERTEFKRTKPPPPLIPRLHAGTLHCGCGFCDRLTDPPV